MRFYAGDIFITSESFKDYIEIAKKITEVIDTQDRNISFSVTVRSGILFRVDGYLYQDKSHGLFLVYSYISGLEKKISLIEGKFVEIWFEIIISLRERNYLLLLVTPMDFFLKNIL